MTTTQYINAHSYFDERKAKYMYKAFRDKRRSFLKHDHAYPGLLDSIWELW